MTPARTILRRFMAGEDFEPLARSLGMKVLDVENVVRREMTRRPPMKKKPKSRTAGTVYRVGRKVGRRVEWEDVHRDWVRSELQAHVHNVRPDVEVAGEFVQPYRLLRLTSAKKNVKRTR